MAYQIAVDADQLAALYQLGTPTAVYKPSTILAMFGGLVVIFFGAAWTMIAFYITSSIGSSFSSTGFPTILRLVFPFFGFIFMLIGVVLIVKAFLNHNLRVQVYQHGLVFHKRNSNDVIRWDQIAYVWHMVKKSTTTTHNTNPSTGYTTTTASTTTYHTYVVQRFDGANFVFDPTFSHLRELGKTIEQEAARYLLPQAIASYNAGHPIMFGKMSVSFSGVSDGRKMLSWSELKSIKVDENNGAIAIRKQGKWLNWSNISLSETPNVLIFETLVNSIVGSRPW
jgi:hypothetical protein